MGRRAMIGERERVGVNRRATVGKHERGGSGCSGVFLKNSHGCRGGVGIQPAVTAIMIKMRHKALSERGSTKRGHRDYLVTGSLLIPARTKTTCFLVFCVI